LLQVVAGIVWVWPDDSPTALEDSTATPLNIPHILTLPEQPLVSWFIRDLPYDYDVLMENLADPSHFPFAHHKLFPSVDR
jgi:phenylpropionate dioxygenase-like ring-hydroxylating dioxygenase large terminal subunit